MPLEFYLRVVVLWVIPTLIAARKGRSFIKWLIIGVIFSPGCAILMALFLHRKPSKKVLEKYAAMP